MLLQLLRAKKKQILKTAKSINMKSDVKQQKLKQVSIVYNLLDAHVYLKNNSWTQANDSMYSFLNSTFNFISFDEILCIIESSFFRALFSYYIYRRNDKDGVLIPNYGMNYLEP